MANEAVIIELLGSNKGEPVNFIVSGQTTVEKGTIMIHDIAVERGAVHSKAADGTFAGIAAAENKSGLTIALYTKGIFDCVVQVDPADTVNAGDELVLSGANILTKYKTLDDEKGYVVGRAMKTITADETITVAVGMY